MTTREVIRRLRQMQDCDCRIDQHCMGRLKDMEHAARTGWLSSQPVRFLRMLHGIQRCPCYFGSHCIVLLCDLAATLSADLRAARARRRISA